jgi:hypothetical protein
MLPRSILASLLAAPAMAQTPERSLRLVIAFPQMVMIYKGQQVTIDPKKVEEQMRNLTIPGGGGFGPPPGFGGGIPGLGGPGGGAPGGIIMPGMPQPKAP